METGGPVIFSLRRGGDTIYFGRLCVFFFFRLGNRDRRRGQHRKSVSTRLCRTRPGTQYCRVTHSSAMYRHHSPTFRPSKNTFFFNAYTNRGGCKIKYPIIDGGHGNRNTHTSAQCANTASVNNENSPYTVVGGFFLLFHNSTKEATAFTFGRTVGRRSICECPPRRIVLKLENVENTRKTEKPIRFGMARRRFHNVVIIIFF